MFHLHRDGGAVTYTNISIGCRPCGRQNKAASDWLFTALAAGAPTLRSPPHVVQPRLGAYLVSLSAICTKGIAWKLCQSICRREPRTVQQPSSQAEDDWNDSNGQGSWGGLAGGESGNPSTDWDGSAGEASTSGRRSWGDREGSSGWRGGRGGGNDWGSTSRRGSNERGRSNSRGGSEGMRARRDWGSEARQRSSTGRPAGERGGREWTADRGTWERGRGRQQAGFGGSGRGEGDSWRRRPEDEPYNRPEGPKPIQLRDLLQGEALYGVNPVLGALEAMRREVYTLYVQEGARPLHASEASWHRRWGAYCSVRGYMSTGALPISCLCQWQKIKWRLP